MIDVGPGGPPDQGDRLGGRVQGADLQDDPADFQERRACLRSEVPLVRSQTEMPSSRDRSPENGSTGPSSANPLSRAGPKPVGCLLHHGLSVTKGCNKVVDRLWAGILLGVPRTIWKGALSFGLVNIPVGLYPATSDKSIHFNQFEEGTSDRIRYKKINERTGEEVPQDRIVRGFDLGGGEYVILTEEELESAEPKKSRQIEISDFVGLVDIDPVFFRSSYYLAPEGAGADKAYALLRRAMAEAGRVAIATLVMRNKEYLVAIRPEEDALALHTMYFSDEVRDPGPRPRAARDGRRDRARALHGAAPHRVDGERLGSGALPRHASREGRGPHRGEAQRARDRVAGGPGARRQGGRPDGGAQRQHRGGRPPGLRRQGRQADPGGQADAGQRAAPAKKAAKTAKQPARPKTAARRKAS